MRAKIHAAGRGLIRSVVTMSLFVVVLWAVFLINRALGGALTQNYGLIPRRTEGLDGILAMPFLHAHSDHLWRNTVPVFVLGALAILIAPRRALSATLIVVVLGGLLTWIFGREANHIGASGLIFGWFGFVVGLGLLERSFLAIIGAFAAIFFYGAPTMLGLLPADASVSYEGHIAGLVAGVAAAWMLRSNRSRRRPGRH
ncbi:MAG: rhomboid family intramembrane serine protease [Neomegalonema sp.]|nr:rhomboid family intramembrane serine protease [Neomegalonema sp.]